MEQLTIYSGIPVYHECGTILDDYAISCVDFAIENTNRNYGEVYRIRGMKFSIDYRINISVIISKKYIQPRKTEKVKELIFTFPNVAPPAKVIEAPEEKKEVCDWCDGGRTGQLTRGDTENIQEDIYWSVKKDSKKIAIYGIAYFTGNLFSLRFKANFCPKCGREL